MQSVLHAVCYSANLNVKSRMMTIIIINMTASLSLSLDDVFGSETSFLVSFSRRSKRTVCCCITQFSPANSHRGLTLAAAGVSLLSRSCSPELYLYCCCFQTKETDSLESLISSVLVYCSRRLQRFFPRLRLACKVSLHSVFAMCCC